MSNDSDDNTKIVAGVLLVPFVAFLAAYRGWFISILWAWFVVPVFALPVLSVPQAIGLSLVGTTFINTSGSSKKQTTAEWTLSALLGPIVGLGLAWVVKQFL